MSKPLQKSETERKHIDAIAEFTKWSSVKELGVQKFTTAYCLAKAGHKTYLSPRTVEKIVFATSR